MTRRGLIHDEGPALGYEAALEAILSLVGRRVDVTVMSADPLGVVGEFAGELARGDDVRPPSRAAGGEAFRFAVGTENSFSVEARLFREAGWVFSTHQRKPPALPRRDGAPARPRGTKLGDRRMTAAIFGLIGVLVGVVLNCVMTGCGNVRSSASRHA